MKKEVNLKLSVDELKRIYDAICFVDAINQVSIIANGLNTDKLLLDASIKKKILRFSDLIQSNLTKSNQ